MNPKAAIIVIGDEILSGLTPDLNSGWLAKQLFDLGVFANIIITIPDNREVIIDWVVKLSKEYDFVFTTGGIGPTHDDVTRESMAKAFNHRFVLHPEAEKYLRDFYKDRITESRLSMAYLPEGVKLIRNPISAAPGFIIENVFVFPGIPELLKLMFSQIIENFNYSQFHIRLIKTNLPESVYAKELFLTAEKYPSVIIGSYPKIYDTTCKTEIVLKSKRESDLQDAFEHVESLVQKLQTETTQ